MTNLNVPEFFTDNLSIKRIRMESESCLLAFIIQNDVPKFGDGVCLMLRSTIEIKLSQHMDGWMDGWKERERGREGGREGGKEGREGGVMEG